MSIVRKIVGWVRGLGFISLARNTHRVDEKSVVALRAVTKNIRLTKIAAERNRLKDKLGTARKQKKARRHIYAALEALRTEELKLESGQ